MSDQKKSITEAFTRSKASKGVLTPIKELPGEHLLIRGLDSDEYRAARDKRSRVNLEILGKHQEEKLPQERLELLHYEANLELFAALVAGWSFKEEPTFDNVCKLLREAPYLIKLIDKTAAERDAFFGSA